MACALEHEHEHEHTRSAERAALGGVSLARSGALITTGLTPSPLNGRICAGSSMSTTFSIVWSCDTTHTQVASTRCGHGAARVRCKHTEEGEGARAGKQAGGAARAGGRREGPVLVAKPSRCV